MDDPAARRSARIEYSLQPLDIVLLQTGCRQAAGLARNISPNRAWDGTGVLWLVEQGVRVIGIDAYTLDRPFASMVADFRRTGDGRYIWPAHFAGITREYCQIEKLANLDRIPKPYGFQRVVLSGEDRGAPAPDGAAPWLSSIEV